MSRTGVFDKDCLYSTVKNGSGGEMVFGFLPPHGVRLAADEEYTVFGNVLERLTERRNQQAFAAAVDRGDIEIVSTPAQIIKDTVTGLSKMLKLTSGTLSAQAPCWDTSDSLEQVPA